MHPPRPRPTLSVLMPVYNERATAETAIEQVLEADLPMEIELIVVDDGSTDGSRELLEKLAAGERFRLLLSDRNRGKGAAVRTGLEQATGEFTAIFDADLEYDPGDLAPLLEPLLSSRANVVFGVRAFDGYTSHSFLYVLGNRFVTLAANAIYNVYIRDLMTCHKAMRTDLFKRLPLRENGFGIEAEITARLLQHGERVFEVPVHYKARKTEEGKKLTSADGFRVLAVLLRCRFGRPARSQWWLQKS